MLFYAKCLYYVFFLLLPSVLLCATPNSGANSFVGKYGNVSWRPVVLLHGLTGSKSSMALVQQWIEQDFPGIYVHNAEIGDGRLDSLLWDTNYQIETFAIQLKADPKLQGGFNLIGHSQGGLFSRAYIERYNDPPVYNYISWAGPHGGVYGVPAVNAYCPDVDCPWLDVAFDLLLENWESNVWLQQFLSFATYWKTPFDYPSYLQYSTLLADINNERPQKSSLYKERMLSLNYVLLIYSTTDNIVIPNTSPLFEHYALGQDRDVVSMKDTDQYKGDWLGLQTLDRTGRLQTEGIPCGHRAIPDASCKHWYTLYTKPLLNNTF